MGSFQYLVVQELPAAGGRKLTASTLTIPVDLEASIYRACGVDGPLVATPTPAPPPPPPPDPQAPPPGAVICRAQDDLSDRVASLKPGQVLALECGGVWREPLALGSRHDGVTVQPFSTGDMPQIIAPIGLMLTGPLDGVTVDGIRFTGAPQTKGDGVSATTTAIRNFTLRNSIVERFRDNVVFQCPAGDNAKFADFHRNLVFVGNRMLDAGGTGERDGQGGYFQNVDGLDIHENLWDGAGMNRHLPDGTVDNAIFCHLNYIQWGNKRVSVSRNIYSRGESFGIQARGPSADIASPDLADPGHAVTDNVFVDCAIGFAVSGAKGAATGNYVLPGHFHGPRWHHGQGGGIVRLGGGDFINNTRLGGPAPDRTRKDWAMPAWDTSPDQPDPANKWRWTKMNQSNVHDNRDFPDIHLDMTPIIQSIRASRTVDIGRVRDAMVRQIEAAIMVKTRTPEAARV